MKIKIISTIVFMLLIGVGILPITGNVVKDRNQLPLSRDSNIFYVGGSGPGNYTKIQDAIDNASDGDTVFVYNGTYYEDLNINKSISLIGEDRNTTVVDGTDCYNVVYVIADWVNISGFTIKYGDLAGIEINSKYNNITNNIISNNTWGIYIKSSHNTVTGNNILNNDWGINLASSTKNNTITCNNIYSNEQYGIYLYNSIYNTFTDNNISNNRDGIRIRYSSNNTITYNNITSNNMRGIWLDSSSATIRDNNISNNDRGIQLYDSSNNTILENNISNNENGIFLRFFSMNNNIIDNTISNNWDGIYTLHYSNYNNTITCNKIISNNQHGIYLISSSNTVTDNNISNNELGIYLYSSTNNTINGNSFLNDGLLVWESYQNIVSNNTVNGKPLVFLEDESDMIIDVDAGQIILVNCDNITVKNQEISNTPVGIELWDTNNCLITGNTFSLNKERGIYLYSSSNNTVNGNNISNNQRGIYLASSSGSIVTDNNISNNQRGIYLYSSSNNTVNGNTISNNYNGIHLYSSSSSNIITCNNIISNNEYGIYLFSSSNNTIYNNYCSNTNNTYDDGNNIWNISKTLGTNIIGGPYLGGNYWSDYTGADLDGDGLGDTDLPYNSSGNIQNGGDWLPLVNSLPYTPSNPDPPDGATSVDINSDLSWDGGDPDSGDTVTYDIYFGTNNPPPKFADNHTETTYELDPMEEETKYYWKIVAWDNHGASSEGPIWNFTTEKAPESDLGCDGSLSWSDVKPGETVEGNFSVSNIGEPLSLLNWEIDSYPEWGIWSFDPQNGTDLTPEDNPITVIVIVTVPDEKNSEFVGDVKIVNKENSSDFCTIDVSLSTPKNKPFSFIHNLLNWLFERFPNAFPILRNILRQYIN